MESFLDNLPRPFMVLAPMDDVTDTVFRQIIADLPYLSQVDEMQGAGEQRSEAYLGYDERAAEPATQQIATSTGRISDLFRKQASAVRRYGPDLYFTEFVNVDGLQSPGRKNLLKKLQFTDKEHPIIAQLWGVKPENYYKTAGELVSMGFDGVDINMGCPVKTVIKNGACAALINNHELANEIIQATREGLNDKLPLSVKTRIGYKEYDKSWLEFIMKKKLNMLSVHLRTAKEMSKVPAHWEFMAEIKALRDQLSPTTLLVGNGDVMSRAEAEGLAAKYSIDGVMIGRGVFHDPFAFARGPVWKNYTKAQKIELYTKHVKLFIETWGEDQRPIHTLNKFCKIYINGFDGAKELREELMQSSNAGELLAKLASK